MKDRLLRLEIQDYVATVTLDRPPVNALNRELRQQIVDVFDMLSDSDDVRAVVLTAQGKVFCAGADLKDRPDPGARGAFGSHNRLTRETNNSIRECSKPVVAAVNGPALGAGMGLMAACDIFVAAETAVFGMPEIDVGIAGGASMLKTLLGRSLLRRMFYTGHRVTAAELYRRGIIEACTAPDDLLPTASGIAREIASKSPLAIGMAKKAANMVDLMPQRDAYRFEQEFTVALSKTEDSAEARRAFFEKRVPVFKGR